MRGKRGSDFLFPSPFLAAEEVGVRSRKTIPWFPEQRGGGRKGEEKGGGQLSFSSSQRHFRRRGGEGGEDPGNRMDSCVLYNRFYLLSKWKGGKGEANTSPA